MLRNFILASIATNLKPEDAFGVDQTVIKFMLTLILA